MRNLCAILSFCLAAAFTSCVTQSKVEDWNRRHPVESAQYCANNYPCKPQDSTITEQIDSTAYLTALNQLTQSVSALNSINDSLLFELQHKDTVCNKYAPVIEKLQQQIKALRDSLKNLPPKVVERIVKQRWVDDAAVKAAEGKAGQLSNQIAVLNDRLESKGKSLSRWKSICFYLGLGELLLLLLYFLFKRK